ncbi:uncharacterized protein JCM6883_002699 [Sporobolomyces salmoneus]|uniref:uncharacterized protein n=1 Tax=Sporobolomyces salmoneus TaxID=183962 RepID=UPI00316EBE2E
MEVDSEAPIVSPPPLHSAQSEPLTSSSSLNMTRSTSSTESAPLVTIQLSCKGQSSPPRVSDRSAELNGRGIEVNAVHRLWSSHLSEQANLERYGAATSIHGHEYTFYVTFRGPLCAKTGQIIALDLLEEILPLSVTEHLSHKNLDTDLSYFLSRPSTLENLCMFAWRNIGVVTRPHPVRVVKVEVEADACRRNEFSGKLSKVRVSYEGEKVEIPSKP